MGGVCRISSMGTADLLVWCRSCRRVDVSLRNVGHMRKSPKESDEIETTIRRRRARPLGEEVGELRFGDDPRALRLTERDDEIERTASGSALGHGCGRRRSGSRAVEGFGALDHESSGADQSSAPELLAAVGSVVAVRLPLRLALLRGAAVLRGLALVAATATVVVVLVAGRCAEVQQSHSVSLSVSESSHVSSRASESGAATASRRP